MSMNKEAAAQLKADINRFLALKHTYPHQLLGIHSSGNEHIIRAFLPDAESVEVVVGKSQPRTLTWNNDSGLFEVTIDAPRQPSYKLRVHLKNGEVKTIHDPYSFPPTIGELDLHLFGEGKHEEIYQKLGAHVMKVGAVKGVAFAVWAPHASGVSVVGNFNNWDGRVHQMRMLYGSGVWELFIPDLSAG